MEKKKYNTKQKEELLQYLIDNSNKFVSAEDIEKYVEKEKINIGLTTIYRFLNSLEEQGKLRVELKEHIFKDHKFIIDSKFEIYGLCNKCYKMEE